MEPRDEQVRGCREILEIISLMSFANLSEEQVHKLVTMREIARQVVGGQFQGVSKIDVARALRSTIDDIVVTCKETLDIISRMSHEGLDDHRVQLMSRIKDIAGAIADRKVDAGSAWHYEFAERFNETDDAGISESMMDCAMQTNHEDVHILNMEGQVFVDELMGIAVKNEEYFMGGELVEQNDNVELLSQSMSCASISWPQNDEVTLDWVEDLMLALKRSSWEGVPSDFQFVMPVGVVDKLIDSADNILSQEPNCVIINCSVEDSRVVVIGDIEGQYHDLLSLMYDHVGLPSEKLFFVFNGNYVGKEPWGLEVLLVLLAWKIVMPSRVCLLRGNHETKSFSSSCGFKDEVLTKYGDQGDYVYKKFLGCFKNLPLASIISNSVYTTHGGLFRSTRVLSSKSIKGLMTVGSLDELSRVNRYTIDTLDDDHIHGGSLILNDVLCSDPSSVEGLREKRVRQAGLWWGPDCTETFLSQSKLKFIIRSHEGPGKRACRKVLEALSKGYSEDHSGLSGKLFTLFSAPEYTQFPEEMGINEGAYAILEPPSFTPVFCSFRAVDRPKACHYIVRNNEDEVDLYEEEVSTSMSLDALGDSIAMDHLHCMAGTNSEVDFGAVGIDNPPSWSVFLADEAGNPQCVQLSEVPDVEGLPLSPNSQH
ncbi:serine/threonine-protein phosphatase 7-like isoform X3 [Syzygium oleosum]|uniref:serine/threonine-protein phosphatase 7-like isoform X3 n=1 Tax=Syzygium oleosum TaxID=219896 RepID=UPI0024B94932|nr:serine/threonine-protein phosphatase 7-like isoform X3 [Syzygium oleosum]XP_056167924.1 serine/threonine-protein phosphatase 7-like isoform X3 [Syzygium oleosum]